MSNDDDLGAVQLFFTRHVQANYGLTEFTALHAPLPRGANALRHLHTLCLKEMKAAMERGRSTEVKRLSYLAEQINKLIAGK